MTELFNDYLNTIYWQGFADELFENDPNRYYEEYKLFSQNHNYAI